MFTLSFAGKLQRVDILPIPDVLFWTSFVAPVLRFTADLASCTPGMGRCFRPALAPVTLSGETRWGDGVCLQSDSSTCAAVTLLRRSGIVAEKRNLVRACLTSDQGLNPLGCIVEYSSIRTAYFTRFVSHHQMPMIGDPAFGKSTWSDEDFLNRFTGEALFVTVARKKFE